MKTKGYTFVRPTISEPTVDRYLALGAVEGISYRTDLA